MKVMPSPSSASASSMVTSALSSLSIVPVASSVSVTVVPVGTSEAVSPTVKVSSPSKTASWVVDTVKLFVSLAVPVKVRAAVFSS